MKDDDYNKARQRVQAICDKWEQCLGLGWLDLRYEWDRSYPTGDVPEHTAATTENMIGWKYREMTIHWYLVNLADLSDEELEKTVVHEFAHCLTAPMAVHLQGFDNDEHGYTADLMEMTTTNITQSLLWTYAEGAKHPETTDEA